MNDLFTKDDNGKIIFIGKEDPNNPPPIKREGTKMQCPVCHNDVDYLLGQKYQACEACYDQTKDEPIEPEKKGETNDTEEIIIE